MSNLYYDELKTRDYLKMEGITTDEALNLFKWRVRMAPLGENFRGNQAQTTCPLCSVHLDSQAMALNCLEINQKFQTSIKIEDIYSDKIPLKIAQDLLKITKVRKKLIENKKYPSAQ